MNVSPPPRALKRTTLPIGERLQTAVLVVLFTGLIWWTANQSVSVTRSFPVRLRLARPVGMTIRLLGSDEFSITLAGPQRMIDAFESRLRARAEIVDYTPTKNESQSAERVEWKAHDIFGDTPLLAGSGLGIKEVTPPVVVVSLDKLETTHMTIVPDFGALEVEGGGVTPTSAKVTLSARELAHHPRRLTPGVEALISNWRIDHPEAQDFSINVPLSLPGVAERIDPPSVTVSGRLLQMLDTLTKGPVQILPAVPLSVQLKYVIEGVGDEDFRTDVSVRGSKDQLAGLSAEQIRAYFDVLTADEGQAGQAITRRVIVVLPKGFDLVGEIPEVRFRLVPREAGGVSEPRP